MREAPLTPTMHLFVCANQRLDDSPLGPGCGGAGEVVYVAMKQEVAKRNAFSVWVTRTHCLGLCPKRGATVAVYPKQRIVSEVEPEDVPSFFDDEQRP